MKIVILTLITNIVLASQEPAIYDEKILLCNFSPQIAQSASNCLTNSVKLNSCYNPGIIWPQYNKTWSEFDIIDLYNETTGMFDRVTYGDSTNGTCSGSLTGIEYNIVPDQVYGPFDISLVYAVFTRINILPRPQPTPIYEQIKVCNVPNCNNSCDE